MENVHFRSYFIWIMIAFWVLSGSAFADATGKVVKVTGTDVVIAITKGQVQPGDRVRIVHITGSGLEIEAGTWTVTSVSGKQVTAVVQHKKISPREGMTAVFMSAEPQKKTVKGLESNSGGGFGNEADSSHKSEGFGDESEDSTQDRTAETITYFDRNFMPQSWKTSGNSQQAKVHIYALGSRLGWAAALARHCGPNAVDLIVDHLNGASGHVKGAHDNSFMPEKTFKDWQEIQNKHQYWIQKLQQRPDIQGQEQQLQSLFRSFKSHALGLAKKIAYPSWGKGLEQQENCDSYYLRIGYYLAYASQSLACAAQGGSKGMPAQWVKRIINDGQSAAAGAARYMQDLKKLKNATGFCIDLGGIANFVYQGTRDGTGPHAMAEAAQKGWQDSLEALGGGS